MALFPLNPGVMPLGQFDVIDTELTSILGGEVMTLTTAARVNSLTETAAADALDGYTYTTGDLRPASTRAQTATEFPLYLSDDGTSPDYLTYMGTLTGPLGLGTGAVIGPHTASGSGKITLWDKPGLYGISVSALCSDFLDGLNFNPLAPGDGLGFGDGVDIGKIGHSNCTNIVAATGVGYFVEFDSGESLVTTPNRLVGATEQFTRLKLQFHAGDGVRTVA